MTGVKAALIQVGAGVKAALVQVGEAWDRVAPALVADFLGPHDSVSWITPYTGLHALSGYVIGVVSDKAGFSVDGAIGAVVGLGVGWEVVEYWMAPALGYWTVRNAANTAIDMVAVIGLFMLTSSVAPSWQGSRTTLQFAGVCGLYAGVPSILRDYQPESHSVSSSWLRAVKTLRGWLPFDQSVEEHRTMQTRIAMYRLKSDPVLEEPWPEWKENTLQDRVLLSPPHRMLAALCAIMIVVHARFDWHGLPTSLVVALTGFALTWPSAAILVEEDKGQIATRMPVVPREKAEWWSACRCPFYRMWPTEAPYHWRRGGRMKSRRVFRTYCLPVRFALMSLLLLVGPRVTGSGVRPVFLLLAALAFCFVAVNIRASEKMATWQCGGGESTSCSKLLQLPSFLQHLITPWLVTSHAQCWRRIGPSRCGCQASGSPCWSQKRKKTARHW